MLSKPSLPADHNTVVLSGRLPLPSGRLEEKNCTVTVDLITKIK